MRAGVVILLLVAAGCNRLKDPDPEVERIKERIRAILPDVEAALGDSIPGRIHVSVVSPMGLYTVDELEEDDDDDVLTTVLRWLVQPSALAVVSDGTIYYCPENFRRTARRRPDLTVITGPAFRDLVLAHELVHVYQDRVFSRPDRSGLSLDENFAFRAAIEGHAEFVMRRVAARRGLAKALADHDSMHQSSKQRPTDDAWIKHFRRTLSTGNIYTDGERFFTAVVQRLGYARAIRRVMREPPRSWRHIEEPDTYLSHRPPAVEGVVSRLMRYLEAERDDRPERVTIERRFRSPFSDRKPERLTLTRAYLSAELELLPEPDRATALDALLDAEEVSDYPTYIRVFACRDERSASSFLAAYVERVRRAYELRRSTFVPLSVADVQWFKDSDGAIRVELRTGRNLDPEQRLFLRQGRFVLDFKTGGLLPITRFAEPMIEAAGSPQIWGGRVRAARRHPEAALEVADRRVRLAAVKELGRRKALIPRMTDRDWEVRWHLFRLRGDGGLRLALDDPHPVVRALACDKLGYGGNLPASKLQALLRDGDYRVRRAALGLIRKETDAGRAALMAALDDPHFVVRTTGADKLSTIDFEGGPFYAKALRDSSRFVRAAALSSLNSNEKTPDEAIDALIDLLPERQGPSAAEALGRAQRRFVQRAIPALRLGLAREGLDDRLTFAVALAALGDEQGFAALDDALRSEGTARTAASKIAELELDAARFVPRLIEMLDAGESFVISALGDIRDKRALPTLQSLADHRDHGLRVQAREAIKKIRGD